MAVRLDLADYSNWVSGPVKAADKAWKLQAKCQEIKVMTEDELLRAVET